jgi:carbamoyl-phosphate synthase large subunit
MSWLATEQSIKGKKVLLSIGGDKKLKLLPSIQMLDKQGWEFYATETTHDFLSRNGIGSSFLYKASEGIEPNVTTAIAERQVDLIINIPKTLSSSNTTTDGFKIRRLAIDHHIPLITNIHIAQLFLQCLAELDSTKVPMKSWNEYVRPKVGRK